MNNNIKILLVDDEPDALDLLECLLINKKGVAVVGSADNKSEAIRKMIDLQPDVIFQDIQMGNTNGLELVDEYRKHHFTGKIVFVTAYIQYAIEAIKKAAFDYLLKPVGIDDLDELLLKLLCEQSQAQQNGQAKTEKLKIPTRTGYSLVNMDEIVFCKAIGNYTTITTKTDEPITTSMHLGKVETHLPGDAFFRLSRSVIINTNFLVSVNKGENICVLKTCENKFKFHIPQKMIKELENLVS